MLPEISMGDVVNLNRFRKRVQAEAAAAKAEANAVRHGRTKAQRKTDAAERTRQREIVEGHRREPEPEPPGDPGALGDLGDLDPSE
jgi:hypothetical protein